MTTHFHNTIRATGDNLIAHTITCKSQEDRILAIFKESGKSMTPFEVEEAYIKLYPKVPITSIRRAMSNLTKDNKLVKTNAMKQGGYDKPNFMWEFNKSLGR